LDHGIKDVIVKNELNESLIRKEIDHLNWANAVADLLTDDNVTELNVQTDDHLCAFGEWLFSDARVEAEKAITELAPIFKEIEGYHEALHTSAIGIKESFIQADAELPGLIAAREVDHLKWAAAVRDCFINQTDELSVQTDHTLCALGKWVKTDQAKKAYEHGDAEFKKIWDEMLVIHEKLHTSAEDIQENLAFGKLSHAQQVRQTQVDHLDQISHKIFDSLEAGMENVIDPAKTAAEQAEDVAAITRWSEIDMVMNEQIVQPFLHIRITLDGLNSDEQWTVYQQQISELATGFEHWSTLIETEPQLKQTGQTIAKLLDDWNTSAEDLHQAVSEENQ
ncbi:MAG: hypothetical protein GY869_22690, partial [Planctomycetes bacterium]|nr:hypothetical protein [Planctomycetota bacterium]